jgi:hypothetical protein
VERIRALGEKLARLKELDVERAIFGVAPSWGFGHGYKMNPVMTPVLVRAFELRHRIKLPADYRAFLQQMGNGGAGPYYGLLPIEQGLPEDLAGLGKDFLATPFPHQEPYEVQLGHDDPKEANRILTEYESNALIAGSLRLAHQGFGYYDILVISGPMQGTMWTDARTGELGITPLGVGFTDWYEGWLDRSLAEVENRKRG